MWLESGIFMVTSLLQGLQISLWKIPDNWDNAQILCLHTGLFLYLMARTGQSRQKRLGFMVWVTSSILAISSHWNISFWESWLYFIKRHLTKSLLKKSNVKTNSTSEWFSLVLSLPWYLLYLLPTSLARSCLLSLSYGNKSSRHLLPASLLNFNINFENSGLFISRLVTNLPLALGLFSKLVAVYWANDKPLSQKQF